MSTPERPVGAGRHRTGAPGSRSDAPDRGPHPEPRIVVVGAGPVGAALALALSRAAIPCSLIDRHGGRSGEPRPVALSYASRQILDALGVWPRLRPLASPIDQVHVSQRACFGATRLSAGDFGLEALGYVIDVGALRRVFDEMLAGARGLCRLSSTTVTGVEPAVRGVRLQLAGAAAESGRRSLEAQAVVAADGAETAWCARHVDTHARREYRQVALGALVRAERDHQGVAYERFTPEGPMALLPLHGTRCALVWTLAPERGSALQHAAEARFLAELHQRFGDRLGRFVEVRNREVVPLRRMRRRTRPQSRIYLAGSAANTLHPVAGQGLNLGLRDVAALAEVFAGAVRSGADPGAPECLARYHSLRRRDQGTVSLATDLLARGFRSEFAPLSLLRGAALVGLDLVTPARREFARHAMGLGFPASRLARARAP